MKIAPYCFFSLNVTKSAMTSRAHCENIADHSGLAILAVTCLTVQACRFYATILENMLVTCTRRNMWQKYAELGHDGIFT